MKTRARRSARKGPEGVFEASIDSLTHDGRGIARREQKPVFIAGSLPGETVRFSYLERRRDYDEGQLIEVLEPSALRGEPRCAHYGLCGGCSYQHVRDESQIEIKSRLLEDQLKRIGGISARETLAPLIDKAWGYRLKARLGVKYVAKKGKVLVGFRERSSGFIADLITCPVLDPRVGLQLERLSATIGELSIRDRIPQIEVAMGDDAVVLVFRILEDLSAEDVQTLDALGSALDCHILVQRQGPDTVQPLRGGEEPRLHYAVPDSNLSMAFRATDFTQVNMGINRKLIARVIELLDPEPTDRVLDLFCGIGNFTLPLARRAAEVVGVEGSREAIHRALENAQMNDLHNVSFHVADLTQPQADAPWAKGRFDRVLLDPSRAGALEILEEIRRWMPSRIVYVSCNPATLARDAALLVDGMGYRLVKAGVMDMFPQTAHVESIAVFEASFRQ